MHTLPDFIKYLIELFHFTPLELVILVSYKISSLEFVMCPVKFHPRIKFLDLSLTDAPANKGLDHFVMHLNPP